MSPRKHFIPTIENLSCVRPTGEHGYFGWLVSGYDIQDLTGLHDARLKTGGAIIPEVVEKEMPGIMWMPHPDYVILYRKLVQADFFQKNYLFCPNAYLFGLAIRKDLIPLVKERGAFETLLIDVQNEKELVD